MNGVPEYFGEACSRRNDLHKPLDGTGKALLLIVIKWFSM